MVGSKELISTVIPTYNRCETVVTAVESALRQNYPSLEVIIVDDGSQDDTVGIIRNRFGEDSRVRLISQVNLGVAAARNTGIRAARGEYIAFLDSDDSWLPGKLELEMECFKIFPDAGMVWTDMAATDAKGVVLYPKYLREMYHAYSWYPHKMDLFEKKYDFSKETQFYFGNLFSPMVLGNLVHTSTTLIRRETVAAAGWFPEQYRTGEDYPFYLNICKVAPVAFVDQVTIHYQIGMSDALSSAQYNPQIAHSYLETLLKTLREERALIHLPKKVLNERLASAHAWVAEGSLGQGDSKQALYHFRKSFKYHPWQPSHYIRYIGACLPSSTREMLVRAKRKLKS